MTNPGTESQNSSVREYASALYHKVADSNMAKVLLAGTVSFSSLAASQTPASAEQSMEVSNSAVSVSVTEYCDTNTNVTTIGLEKRFFENVSGVLTVGDREMGVGNLSGEATQFLKFPVTQEDEPITFTLTGPGETVTRTLQGVCNYNPNLAAPDSGYWIVEADGGIHSFGIASEFGNLFRARDVAATPDSDGLWVIDEAGAVFPRGAAQHYGDRPQLEPGERITSIAATPTGKGYWLGSTRGRLFNYGDAITLKDLRGTALNGEIQDMMATPSGRGVYMVGADGGVFTLGDAQFEGSMGDKRLNKPVVSMAPDPDGKGYWLVAADGGIFAFKADFKGSTGNLVLNQPVIGMLPYGDGYMLFARDGGIFNFSNKAFHGSLGGNPPNSPVVSVAIAEAPKNRAQRRMAAQEKQAASEKATVSHLGRVTVSSKN